jgi:hypothetical protein
MSLTVNSGSSTVVGNIQTGLSVPATGQTIVKAGGKGLGTGSHNLYTVPASKIFYLMGASLSNNSGANNLDLQINGTSDRIVSCALTTSSSINLGCGSPLAVLTAGEVLQSNSNVFIWGVLIDA